jgi:hypothetical protein
MVKMVKTYYGGIDSKRVPLPTSTVLYQNMTEMKRDHISGTADCSDNTGRVVDNLSSFSHSPRYGRFFGRREDQPAS